MFQRIKGAIDSRIAEEQARQRAAASTQQSPSRSAAKRSSSRTLSPSRNAQKRAGSSSAERAGTGKGPDPAEFDPDVVVGGDDIPSRAATPQGQKEQPSSNTSQEQGVTEGSTEAKAVDSAETMQEGKQPAQVELPTEVRVKLRKLDKLEPKYSELLRSYRIAHARVTAIEAFETTLREHTPLTSISDPSALVEYLNQLSVKSTMVMDELKRVSEEKDSYKAKFEEAEKAKAELSAELSSIKEYTNTEDSRKDTLHARTGSVDSKPVSNEKEARRSSEATSSFSLRASSLSSLFSPKQAPQPAKAPTETETEELFSYDTDTARLENDHERQDERISELTDENTKLKGDLAITKKSSQALAKDLQTAKEELEVFRNRSDPSDFKMEETCRALEASVAELTAKLEAAQQETTSLEKRCKELEEAKNALSQQLDEALQRAESSKAQGTASSASQATIKSLQEAMAQREAELSKAREAELQSQKRNGTLKGLLNNVRTQLNAVEIEKDRIAAETHALQSELQRINSGNLAKGGNTGAKAEPEKEEKAKPADNGATATTQKKGKKKKKGAKGPATVTNGTASPAEPGTGPTDSNVSLTSESQPSLQMQIDDLRQQLVQKEALIDGLNRKVSERDDLKEEIETLRGELIHVGQDHVQAKEQIKDLLSEKDALQENLRNLERELEHSRSGNASRTADSEQKHSLLAAEFQELKQKADALQTDLSVAQQLAASRFKDLTDLRQIYLKVQPELSSLRTEVSELRSAKDQVASKTEAVNKLESRVRELQGEVAACKKQILEKDTEIRSLNDKCLQQSRHSQALEESNAKTQRDLEVAENDRKDMTEAREKLATELTKVRAELRESRVKMQNLQEQLSTATRNANILREDIELKSAQYASAQSLMNSVQDQSHELGVQMKEVRQRCESLEEELADAHRLLSERSREGEVMRRLLADVEGRAEARIKEMRDRMDIAIEERDRAEEEATLIGRKRSREVEELKNKIRNAERDLSSALEDKEGLVKVEKDLRQQLEEIGRKEALSNGEAEEVRRAMGELRDALDEGERQVRELERDKAQLRRSLEESQGRLEKLQKSSKSMAEELRSLQSAKLRSLDSSAQSKRSSIDSSPSRPPLNGSLGKPGSPAPATPDGQGRAALDYVYLKNVLLQFLEQKDKKHQMQLVPVLGMLLHFDKMDEQKWVAAITAK